MGLFRFDRRQALFNLVLLGSLSASAVAVAQTMAPTASPSSISETQGATSGLGSSHRFATTAAAASHCSNDTIIWSSGPDLIYALPSSPHYGKGKGFYACKGEADDSGFHPESN